MAGPVTLKNSFDKEGDLEHAGATESLAERASSVITIITPDITGLFDDLNVCDLITNPTLLLDGLDALLGTIESGLGNEFVRNNLPLVGPQLGKAADFIGDFRSGFLAEIVIPHWLGGGA